MGNQSVAAQRGVGKPRARRAVPFRKTSDDIKRGPCLADAVASATLRERVHARIMRDLRRYGIKFGKRRCQLMSTHRIEDCRGAALFQGERTQQNHFFIGD